MSVKVVGLHTYPTKSSWLNFYPPGKKVYSLEMWILGISDRTLEHYTKNGKKEEGVMMRRRNKKKKRSKRLRRRTDIHWVITMAFELF